MVIPRKKRPFLKLKMWFLLVLTVTIAFFLAISPGSAAPPLFSDVSPGQSSYPYINFLFQKGLVKGYPDSTFRPEKTISRGEIATLLVKACGLSPYKPKSPTFKDVPPNHWAHQIIETAAKAGMVKGYPDGTFRPNNPVTRAEAATLILLMTKEPLPEVSLPAVVKDVKAGHWATNQIAASLDAGLFTMVAEGSFAPDQPATRAQVARALAVMLNISPKFMEVTLEGKLVPLSGEVTITQKDGTTLSITRKTPVGSGVSIATGRNGLAELRFPDGSGLRIEPNTEISIKTARGQSTIFRDSSPGVLVDLLELELPKGKVFGALSATYFFQGTEQPTAQGSTSGNSLLSLSSQSGNNFRLAQLTQSSSSQTKLPWWKLAFTKRIRVRVNMPWGVAGIRGTLLDERSYPGPLGNKRCRWVS
jgi:hypothetical protein